MISSSKRRIFRNYDGTILILEDLVVGGGRCIVAVHAVAGLTVLGLGRIRCLTSVVYRGASHASFVAGSDSCRMVTSGKTSGTSSASSHLCITSTTGLTISLPEWSTGSASVVVRRAWSIALFLLVVTHQKELNRRGDQEEKDVDDSNGKAGGVQATDISPISSAGCILTLETRAERCVDDTLA